MYKVKQYTFIYTCSNINNGITHFDNDMKT